MTRRPSVTALLTCALAAGAPVALAQDCAGAVCEIPAPPRVTDASYDPADVDWAGLIQTVKKIGEFEPRFCMFAIRTAFHDAGSFTGGDGADGSIILDDSESMLEDNTQAGFVPYARAIMAHLGAFYGASAADLLTVVGAYGPVCLGAIIDPAFDNLNNTPLYVGRIDHGREASTRAIRAMHDALPKEFDAMPKFLSFWDETLTPHVTPPPGARFPDKWDGLVARDIVALMGAHTLMDNFGCQEQGCGGEKKMFLWNTDWFKDMASGSCTPRKRPEIGVDHKPVNAEGGKGRQPNEGGRRVMRVCSFKSEAGLELADNFQCQIDEVRGGAENSAHQAGFSFQFVDWRPTDSRSECCGDGCDACTGDDTTWWCEGSEAGTSSWPYTWGDCELSFALAEEARGTYCEGRSGVQYEHEVDCSAMNSGLANGLKIMASGKAETGDPPPLQFFEQNQVKFTHYFNKGMNRMASIGATWGDNTKTLHSLVECGPTLLCAGEVMPVPDGVCEPLATIFAAAAAAPPPSENDLTVQLEADFD